MNNLNNEISQSLNELTSDLTVYSFHAIRFNFLPEWKKLIVRTSCAFRGHEMADMRYGNSYCKKCLHEKVKEK